MGVGTPSFQEIAEHFGFKSPTTVADHLRLIRQKGALTSEPGRARSLRVISPWQSLKSLVVDIPIFGSILSSFPIVAVALISSGHFDLKKGFLVLSWIILIHLFEANLFNPKIMGNAAKIHPVLVVFALIAGEHSYGLVGALFAVPVASIIQTIFVYYRRRRPKPPVTGATPPPALTPAT